MATVLPFTPRKDSAPVSPFRPPAPARALTPREILHRQRLLQQLANVRRDIDGLHRFPLPFLDTRDR
jgi:hypothetical protein